MIKDLTRVGEIGPKSDIVNKRSVFEFSGFVFYISGNRNLMRLYFFSQTHIFLKISI